MKKLSKLILMVCLFQTVSAQNYIDVIHLKNGDVAKGVIIENAPNNYVIIEMNNGSVITFKYDQIEKFTKEKINTKTNFNSVEDSKENNEGITTKKSSIANYYKSNIYLKLGFFSPSDKVAKDIYSESGISIGIGTKYVNKNDWGYQIEVEYHYQEGDPYTATYGGVDIYDATSEIKTTSISATTTYNFQSNGDMFPFVGIGSSYFIITEKISVSSSIGSGGDEGTFKNWGFNAIAGIDFPVNNPVIRFVGIEAKLSSVTFTSTIWDEIDFGGVTVSGILKF